MDTGVNDIDFGDSSKPPYVKVNGNDGNLAIVILSPDPFEVFWQKGLQTPKFYSEEAAVNAGCHPRNDKVTALFVGVPYGTNGDGSPILRKSERAAGETEGHPIALLDVKVTLSYSMRQAKVKGGRLYTLDRTGSGRETKYTITPVSAEEAATTVSTLLTEFQDSPYFSGQRVCTVNYP